MTDIKDLIAQRNELDRQIQGLREEARMKRDAAWDEIEQAVWQLDSGQWRKDDMVFTIGRVTVTLANRRSDCHMYVEWGGNGYRIDFSDPVPVAALMALIDGLQSA